MPHVDPELLALHALGEHLPTPAASHLDACAECATEAASLRAVVGLGRSLGEETLVAPPPPVWSRIAAATGVDEAALAQVRAQPARPLQAELVRIAPTSSQAKPWTRWVLVAAVVGVVAGGAAVLGWQALTDEGGGAPVLATATLDPLSDPEATGTATVVESAGGRELTVSLDTSAPSDGFLEVWLLAPDASQLVSLGVLRSDSATFAVPDGLDIEGFPVVDISVEPFDGDPAHSGDSVARGTLTNA